ncbi:MAG: hypothetical protein ACXVEX_14430, partial [Actinomycetota bacterium]
MKQNAGLSPDVTVSLPPGAARVSRRSSHAHEPEPGVDSSEIGRVARQYIVTPLARAKNDGGVHDVRRSRHATELAYGPRSLIIERDDLDQVRSEQPHKTSLPGAISPH